MNIAEAMFLMKQGKKLTRKEWVEGKANKHFVIYVHGKGLLAHSAEKAEQKVSTHLAGYFGVNTTVFMSSYFVKCEKDDSKDVGYMRIGWQPSFEDLDADDWEVMD